MKSIHPNLEMIGNAIASNKGNKNNKDMKPKKKQLFKKEK